jgi:hypothetical protein
VSAELDDGGAHLLVHAAPAFDPDVDGVSCATCGAFAFLVVRSPRGWPPGSWVACARCRVPLYRIALNASPFWPTAPAGWFEEDRAG